MTEETQPRHRNRKRLWIALAALVAILAILIVPPFLSVSRYKSGITRLISSSLGRPVRLSSVEVHLLPRPGFLLTDLTVAEDPAYGAEPVLHANTVTASIRLLSLWRGRLEIDSISVDEASLNLVRTPEGRWNLDSLLRTAAGQSAPDGVGLSKPVKLPYLEATNSRINIKNGAEKLPFSLLNADLSFWQQSPGDWRLRLRGQPVRTDLTLEQADTGIVELKASLRQSPELRQMPVHLDLEWREAQLGQLTRLLLGVDAGWRGDLTGELHLDGSADAAQITTRLRATSVHRAEFAPAAPMDFDANCTLLAHFSARTIDNFVCDSPIGNGHARLTGKIKSVPVQVRSNEMRNARYFVVELDRIPVAAVLDALRTARSGMAPGLVVAGTASGKIAYAESPEEGLQLPKAAAPPWEPLQGSLNVEGVELRGGGLSEPIDIAKFQIAPSRLRAEGILRRELTTVITVPAGATTPLTVSASLALSGYQLALRGQASVARARELTQLAGIANATALDTLAGEPLSIDLTADGPWMTAQSLPSVSGASPLISDSADSLTGTVIFRNANWKPNFLANHVVISQATLHLTASEWRWDPIIFSYGPVKGTASLSLPAVCDAPLPCPPTFQLQFGKLDASVLQAAFLGAGEKGTMLSTLIDRFRSTAAPPWPLLQGTVKAESLLLGPVSLREPEATLATLGNGVQITAFDTGLLGGRIRGTGVFHAAASAQQRPSYEFEGQFDKLIPFDVGKLLGLRSSGGDINGNGKIALSGFTAADLAASAKGTLHFGWQRGAIASGAASFPPALNRFDLWNASAEIANGALTLQGSLVRHGARSQPLPAAVIFANPPRLVFPASKPAPAIAKPRQE